MSLYSLILWNQVDILQKHFKKDHVHMRLWTRLYGIPTTRSQAFEKRAKKGKKKKKKINAPKLSGFAQILHVFCLNIGSWKIHLRPSSYAYGYRYTNSILAITWTHESKIVFKYFKGLIDLESNYSQPCLSRICWDWRNSFDLEKIRLMRG